ncbi:membrane bound YbgT-like protein [Bisgaardia hudsonensis]|uniref:Membrane bound YbgT-like protein n=1 Tax=Bisgaardia hudsonensis TaxID=109472 RepID=A0A4R2N278_9PAST|nr:cytochrome bd oxidase small subunit, CydX/CbdX family [Bisgaardia hudsonensis]TCP13974.1 membrane bound YbgT-like protein [Bisgaardia hudsonensis]
MYYVLWVVGVLLAVMLSAIVTIGIEKTGKFDE